MLVELCARNYETSNGLVNVVDGIFEDFTKTISKYFVWIHFQNPHIRHNTQSKKLQIYDEFPRLNKQWTPIECKIAKIHSFPHYHEDSIPNSISCNTNYTSFTRVDS
jgi:hypothetical protein